MIPPGHGVEGEEEEEAEEEEEKEWEEEEVPAQLSISTSKTVNIGNVIKWNRLESIVLLELIWW